ncbi:MAG: TetR/AcrR family transcriptional regulator [Thermomicrobiales bacterium]
MGSDSRERMVRSAAALIGARGLNATSFSDVIADSAAPRGSIYHHFPQGKKQLAEEAIQWTSEQILAYQRACTAKTAAGVLHWFIDLWRQSLVASGCTAGCPVVGVAINTVADDVDLIAVVRAAFQSWVVLLASQFEAVGIPAPRATPLALTALAGMEGALILCRAEGDSGTLEAVTDELLRLLPTETTGSGQGN